MAAQLSYKNRSKKYNNLIVLVIHVKVLYEGVFTKNETVRISIERIIAS